MEAAMITRRSFFAALAGVPLLGKLAPQASVGVPPEVCWNPTATRHWVVAVYDDGTTVPLDHVHGYEFKPRPITLEWEAVDGATSYVVHHAASSTNPAPHAPPAAYASLTPRCR